jgi:long-chain fatty acid transport protein
VEPVAGLRLGAGLNIEHVTATLGNALPNLSAALPDGSQVLQGSAWDMGFSVGGQYHTGPLTLGVSYKSSVKHQIPGTITTAGLLGPLAASNGSISATATFTTPWQLIVGGRYQVSRAITLNAQATRSGWANFDAIRLGAPVNAALPQHYNSVWTWALGVDAAVSPKWTLRGGVARDNSPVRSEERDARVPDTDRWVLATGASRQLGKRFVVDFGANLLFLHSGAINRTTAAYAGTAVQTPILVNGSVNGGKVLVLALGGRFKL